MIRSTVEETLNAMQDAEADRLCWPERYERTEARRDTLMLTEKILSVTGIVT